MQTVTDIAALDQLVVFNLDVHIWSARKKLLPQDVGSAALPPEELASLGSKRVCNPDDLKMFTTLKARATSLLERAGIRFLNGWAIPLAKLDEIDRSLADIREEFNLAKQNFLNGYGRSVQDWIESHPQWGSIIANSVVSEDYVRSRLDFRWQIFRILPPRPDETMQDSLDEDVKNLGQSLYDEIAKSASEIWRKCYEGKVEVSRKALSPLKGLYDKLMGLAFVEPRVSSIATLIHTAISSIPQQGPICGGALLMLQGLTALLRNPQEIVEHGQKILDGQKADCILTEVMQSVPDFVPQIEDSPESEPDNAPCPVPALENYGLW